MKLVLGTYVHTSQMGCLLGKFYNSHTGQSKLNSFFLFSIASLTHIKQNTRQIVGAVNVL